jgi:hypothetical protein
VGHPYAVVACARFAHRLEVVLDGQHHPKSLPQQRFITDEQDADGHWAASQAVGDW